MLANKENKKTAAVPVHRDSGFANGWTPFA